MLTPGLSLRLPASPSRLPAGSQLFVWIDSMVSDHARAAADAAGWSGAVCGWTCGQCGLAKLWVTSKSGRRCAQRRQMQHLPLECRAQQTHLLAKDKDGRRLGRNNLKNSGSPTLVICWVRSPALMATEAEAKLAKLLSTPPEKVAHNSQSGWVKR